MPSQAEVRRLSVYAPKPTLTAGESYRKASKDVAKMLASLKASLKVHKSAADDSPSWGRVGDLYDIKDKLEAMVTFLG